MVKLEPGNCPLKPSQRRQLISWLKRAIALGERVGDFFLTISIRRLSGRRYEMRADVRDAIGDFTLRTRGQTWRDVCRAMVRMLAIRLHDQRIAGDITAIGAATRAAIELRPSIGPLETGVSVRVSCPRTMHAPE